MRVSIFLVAALAAAAVATPNPKLERLVETIKNVADRAVDLVCTEEYAPVCGSNFKTYSNACRAYLAGVTVQFEGECPTPAVDPVFCPENYDPVCGSDGVTYSNACFAGVAQVEVVAQGECPTPVVEPPSFVCGEIYAPVCGSDGTTYPNECFAGLAKVTVVAQGECPTPVVEPPSFVCGEIYAPVCGADGNTYSNKCFAKVANVEVVAEGECPTPVVEDPSFVCGQIYAPVCGSDGTTYPNECFAGLAKVTVVSQGECASTDAPTRRPRGTIPPPQTESCEWSCGAQGFNPVCGADGKTYSNACSARCRGATVASEGECAHSPSGRPTHKPRRTNPPPQTESCEWSCGAQGFNPVCGADGKTYQNACSARCRGAVVAAEGACTETATVEPTETSVPACICTKEYFPVCGRDGNTYGNKCEARCAKVKIAHLGQC